MLKQTARRLLKRFKRLPTLTKVIVGVGLFVVLGYVVVFAVPKSVNFSYAGDTCVRQLTLFPSVMKQRSDSGFMVTYKDTLVAGNHPIASLTTCFSALRAPVEGRAQVSVSPFGFGLAMKRFALLVGAHPAANAADFVGKTLPITRPVEIGLTQPDDLFQYKLRVGEEAAACKHEESKLLCDIEAIGLVQGQEYEATLERYFNEQKLEDVGGGEITTLRALVLVSATVSEGQTVYDKPTQLAFEYDKPLAAAEAELKVRSGDTLATVEATVLVEGAKVIVAPKTELQRNAQFELTLKKAEAKDGSALPGEYKVNFTMSGGPKVTGVSVGSISAPVPGSITLTFDQEIANVDSIGKLVTVQGLGASVTKSGNRLIINYANAGQCTGFTITVKKGLESQYGVAQGEDWSFAGRTICYSLRTIGYSKQGRAITAYIFGSGGKTILYTGAIHGNEQSTRLLMNAWVNELEVNARSIPAGTRIVVIPSVNPDGVATNSRYNANGVDLNRNYNTSDWQKDVQTVNGDPLPGGGGSAPGSEPETQALASYTNELRPRLTMSYHSSASYAIANTCGDSSALAQTYAQMTGYRNMTGVSGAFDYQITGTYDDWICERLGLPSVLIELSNSYYSEFSRNKAALWAMAKS